MFNVLSNDTKMFVEHENLDIFKRFNVKHVLLLRTKIHFLSKVSRKWPPFVRRLALTSPTPTPIKIAMAKGTGVSRFVFVHKNIRFCSHVAWICIDDTPGWTDDNICISRFNKNKFNGFEKIK